MDTSKTHLFYRIIHFSVQFSALVNRFNVKHNLIQLLKMIKKENKILRKMFIVTEYAALNIWSSVFV